MAIVPPPIFSFQQILGSGPFATVIRGFTGISPYGTAWFLDSVNGSDGNDGKSAATAFSTFSKVLAVAAAGDSIIVAAGSSFTLTAALSIALANLTILGMGNRNSKPIITHNGGAADGITLDAAGITIDNFHFAAPGTDGALDMIKVNAAGCRVGNISGIGSQTAKKFVDCIVVATGANDCTVFNVNLWNSVAALGGGFLNVSGAVARLIVSQFFAYGNVTNGGIAIGGAATQILLEACRVKVIGTNKKALDASGNPTGVVNGCRWAGTDATIANNANYGNALILFDSLVTKVSDASKQGAQIPAVDS